MKKKSEWVMGLATSLCFVFAIVGSLGVNLASFWTIYEPTLPEELLK